MALAAKAVGLEHAMTGCVVDIRPRDQALFAALLEEVRDQRAERLSSQALALVLGRDREADLAYSGLVGVGLEAEVADDYSGRAQRDGELIPSAGRVGMAGGHLRDQRMGTSDREPLFPPLEARHFWASAVRGDFAGVARSGSPQDQPFGLDRSEFFVHMGATMVTRETGVMTRVITVGGGQLGPVQRSDSREMVVDRLIALLRQAKSHACDLVVFPELALTTFFPRWFFEAQADIDAFFETEMPSAATKPLFEEAAHVGVGFSLGFAELTPHGHHYNSQILVGPDGVEIGRYRKVHLPGHEEYEAWRAFQHLERRYFEPGPGSFPALDAFCGNLGMAKCTDRG